jgi:hypothetical protein
MDRIIEKILIVNDDDLECNKDQKEIELDDIKLNNVGFVTKDLEQFKVIVYKGRLGKKVLRLNI